MMNHLIYDTPQDNPLKPNIVCKLHASSYRQYKHNSSAVTYDTENKQMFPREKLGLWEVLVKTSSAE